MSRSTACASGTRTVRGAGRAAFSSHSGSLENSQRSSRSGRPSRWAMAGVHDQRSRPSACAEAHAPSRSGQSRSRQSGSRVASKAPAARSRKGAASESPAGASIPSASAKPLGVGTAKRAGWTKANSSSRSSPDRSG